MSSRKQRLDLAFLIWGCPRIVGCRDSPMLPNFQRRVRSPMAVYPRKVLPRSVSHGKGQEKTPPPEGERGFLTGLPKRDRRPSYGRDL